MHGCLHINFGYRLLDAKCQFMADIAAEDIRDDASSKNYFADPSTAVLGRPRFTGHDADGHAFRYLSIKRSTGIHASATLRNAPRQLGLRIDYDTVEFPRLGQWVHWGNTNTSPR